MFPITLSGRVETSASDRELIRLHAACSNPGGTRPLERRTATMLGRADHEDQAEQAEQADPVEQTEEAELAEPANQGKQAMPWPAVLVIQLIKLIIIIVLTGQAS